MSQDDRSRDYGYDSQRSRSQSQGSSRSGSGSSAGRGPSQSSGQSSGSRAAPGKKKKRKGNGVLGALLYVAFVLGVSTLLAGVGWVVANDVLALNKEPASAVITITGDDKFGDVVKDLEKNGIIEYKWAFNLFASLSGAKEKLVPGSYELNTDMDYSAIIRNLGSKSASRMTVSVTIPEGFHVQQVFQRLEENGVSTVELLENQAATYDYKFSFLQDIPMGDKNRLEGYLFPDTYEFYVGEDPKTVLNKMLANFDKKFTDEMRTQAQEMGYSVRDIVIIASMIEKETDGGDQTTISSVIYNRLKSNEGGTNGFLQIDATIAYVTGRVVTEADYEGVIDPYNTYLNKGLPPGPIANPGLASIRSALHPADTSYFYYVLGNDGKHEFFKTHKGQLDFIAQQKAEREKNG